MSEHELWNEIGNLYFMSGAYDQAVYAYHRSIELDGTYGRPYSNLALTYVQQGKYQEAVVLYRRSLERLTDEKEKAISWNRLGNVHRHLKEYRQAIVAYQQADELDPHGATDFFDGPEGTTDRGLYQGDPAILSFPTDSNPGKDDGIPTHAVEEILDNLPDGSPNSPMPADPILTEDELQLPAKSGSQTSWVNADFEEAELDPFPPFEDDDEEFSPDVDDQGIGQWLPIPERNTDREFETDANMEEAEESRFSSLSNDVETQSIGALETANTEREENSRIIEKSVNHSPLGHSLTSSVESTPHPMAESGARRIFQAETYTDLLEDIHSKTETPNSSNHRDTVEEQPYRDFIIVPDTTVQNELAQPNGTPAIKMEVLSTIEVENSPGAIHPKIDDEETKEFEAQIAKYKRVVQINPRNAVAWDALGTLYKSIENYKEAIDAYQQALNCDPSKALYYHHLGLVYACEKRDEDAIGAFKKVIEIDPDYSLAHATLGGYYRKMGLEELAQQHIGKAMKSIFDSENEYNRACMQAICGNADQAIELLGVALKNKQTYVDWILRDPDLDFIRQDPRFKQLISDYTK